MLVSVFTPSHDPTWLAEVYACLQRQTYARWEWVLVPNGPQRQSVLARAVHLVEGDSRVRIVPFDREEDDYNVSNKIGCLKRFACAQCAGDLFAEVDHDDLLTDDCLEAVVQAAREQASDCFIYSDDVTLEENGSSCCFDAAFGWQHYDWTYHARAYRVNHCFPITPRALCEILYAPDHIRVWSRGAYEQSGGHDSERAVADDHDLMIRTYLAGVPFVHIPRPLYFHRLRRNNTCVPRAPEIQEQSRALRDRHLHALVAEWCRREQLPMYDLGGAHNCPEGYIPIDRALPADAPQGLRRDVRTLQLPPNSVGCFRAFDFLEHLPVADLVQVWNRLYQQLAPGGWLLTQTPAVCDDEGRAGRGAFQDPTHVSYWSSNNFWYFTKQFYARFVPEITCRFQAVRLENSYPSEFHRTHLIPYVTADLCALKEENAHWPGPRDI